MWIAFIFQYLWDTTQQYTKTIIIAVCCELLSFFSIFEIQHNILLQVSDPADVVNCFHFSVSLRYNTTIWTGAESFQTLWIAFIFQYLWDTTQQWNIEIEHPCRCELLSFFSIFEIQHNLFSHPIIEFLVVNCFHFSVSLRYNTTQRPWSSLFMRLWIAFIFQYLWDTTQPLLNCHLYSLCCELLSFFSIFEIQHNQWIEKSYSIIPLKNWTTI